MVRPAASAPGSATYCYVWSRTVSDLKVCPHRPQVRVTLVPPQHFSKNPVEQVLADQRPRRTIWTARSTRVFARRTSGSVYQSCDWDSSHGLPTGRSGPAGLPRHGAVRWTPWDSSARPTSTKSPLPSAPPKTTTCPSPSCASKQPHEQQKLLCPQP